MPRADLKGVVQIAAGQLFFPTNGHDVDFLFSHARCHDHGTVQDEVRRPFNGAGGYGGGTARLQVQPAYGFRLFVLGPVAVVERAVAVGQAVVLSPFRGEFRYLAGNGVY